MASPDELLAEAKSLRKSNKTTCRWYMAAAIFGALSVVSNCITIYLRFKP